MYHRQVTQHNLSVVIEKVQNCLLALASAVYTVNVLNSAFVNFQQVQCLHIQGNMKHLSAQNYSEMISLHV